MFDINNLLRENIKRLTPYSSARDDYKGDKGIFLDANENSFGSSVAENLNRYPDPYQVELKQQIAKMKNLSADQVFIGNGSDEAIDLLIRAFCNPGKDNIIVLSPTYGMYKVSANINDVAVKEIELTPDFQIDLRKTLNTVDTQSKLLFICSPNNPSGNIIDRKSIEEILKAFKGVVVLDEAYIDFCEDKSWIAAMEKYPNLVILQTLSKAWGLANIRLGMAFSANKKIIEVLSKIKPPYNINGNTQRIALQALLNQEKKNEMVKNIFQEKGMLQKQLLELKVVQKVFPSDANFFLVKMNNAERIFNYLIENKIIVRNRSTVALCEGCLRITIGTATENKELIKTLQNYKP